MLPEKIKHKHLPLILLILLLYRASSYSQVLKPEKEIIDTSSYVSMEYRGAIDYNLMIAASRGYAKETLRLILEGADIFVESDEGVTPLIFAISGNHTEAAKILIEYGSDLNKVTRRGDTPLIMAVKNENADITEALIRAGADVDLADRFEATPLHYASVYDYFRLTDMLLYYNASIDKKSTEGFTPLMASIWAGNADIADLLIQNGANMESRDKEGFTPFLLAALNGDTLLMDMLYKKGVDIYAVNQYGQNALGLSIIADKEDAVRYLLKIGKKWNEKVNDATSPYTIASKYRRKKMFPILKENNITGQLKYEIDQVDVNVSTKFSIHDIYTGARFLFREPYLNGGLVLGLDTKIWYTRVLQKQTDNIYYQYWNKGTIVYAGFFKDFALTDYAFKGNFSISTSVVGGYSFDNVLKGTLSVPKNMLLIIPSAGVKWTLGDLSLNLDLEYMKSDFYKTGPLWLRTGVSYTLHFNNLRTKGKTLKWY
jgi:ankyrin repeat protein